MMFRLAEKNLRIQSDPSGGPLTFTLQLGGGGRMARVAQYSLVFKASSGSNVRINVTLLHGPDGQRFDTHSEVIGTSSTPVAIPATEVLIGDADQSIILNEHLALQITIQDSAATNPQWALLDVYEMRKPF